LYHAEGNQTFRALDPVSGADVALASERDGWMFDARPAPDGREIAVFWNRNKLHSQSGLWTIDNASGEARQLTTSVHLMPLGWTADGTQLLARMARRDHAEHLELVRVPRAGGSPTPWVTLPVRNDSECTLAGDGRRAVCAVTVAQTDLWLIENVGALEAAAR
jgi:hypothetical protein